MIELQTSHVTQENKIVRTYWKNELQYVIQKLEVQYA